MSTIERLFMLLSFFSFTFLTSCNTRESLIFTVNEKIPASSVGKTLHHEHLLVNFIGAGSTGYHRWNRDSVVEKVLPYLLEIKKQGYNTLIECTPAYLGRDPLLLKMLSEKSGIQLITNTGYYSARQMKTRGLLQQVLFSHDAGWYTPGEPGGGNFRGFTEIEELLIPALRENGLSQQDIKQLFVINPSRAFAINKRMIQSL